MAELHPFFVHFPIALLLAAAAFDLFAVLRSHAFSRISAHALQVMAAVSAILAGFSGNLAETGVKEQQHLFNAIQPPLTHHTGWGNAMVWLIIIFAVGRSFALLEKKAWARTGWLFPLASLVLSALVIYTGLLGGWLGRAVLDYFTLH